MLDQFLTRIFSSRLVFAILAVALLALAEFGWRVGLARSPAKPEEGGWWQRVDRAFDPAGFQLCHGGKPPIR